MTETSRHGAGAVLAIAALTAALATIAPTGAQAASLVAARAIPSGAVISRADLAVSRMSHVGGISDFDDAIGQEAKLTIYPGGAVLAANLRPPALVDRNDLVEMTFNRGPLSIRAEGRALDRGALGERVRVMNLSSRAIVTGVVAAAGAVSVAQ